MNATQDTIELLKGMKPAQLSEDIAKAYTQGTGLVAYDLQPFARTLYPVLTPLRNIIPRISNGVGTATNWKAILGVNIANMRAGVSEGNRGGIITDSVVDRVAAYKGLGLENNVSFEAQYASQGFDDARAKAVQALLNSMMLQEERVILGGNNSLALGTTPTPTVANSGTGGTIAAATYNLICVALSFTAWRDATVTGGVPVTINRTNADGTSDSINGGHAQASAAGSTTTTGSTSVVTGTVTPVNGAVAYAWYLGTTGNERLAAITTINSVSLTALPTGTNQLASALAAAGAGDRSRDSLVFDGMMTQLYTPGSGAIISTAATGTAGTGTSLTTDGAGGINEFEAMFASFWDASRLSPDVIWMSARSLMAANKIVLANGGAPLIRFSSDSGGQTINAGTVIGSYLNKITNKQVQLKVHPDMPDGSFLFWSNGVPYPLSNVENIVQMKMRQDYYQLEWPLRTRKYEFGVYADGLLQNYFPPAFGILQNYRV